MSEPAQKARRQRARYGRPRKRDDFDDLGPFSLGRYTEEDVEELLIDAGAFRRDGPELDALLTAEWGDGFDKALEPGRRPLADKRRLSPAVARLGRELCPRYHFAGTHDAKFELPPYLNARGRATRERHRGYGSRGPRGDGTPTVDTVNTGQGQGTPNCRLHWMGLVRTEATLAGLGMCAVCSV